MRSVTTRRFRKAYAELPEYIQEQTRKAYNLWKKNIAHPSLQFKQIHDIGPIYSVRVSLSYRAIGVKEKGINSNFAIRLFGFSIIRTSVI